MKKRTRNKGNKVRRANKEPLAFAESPVNGDYATQSPVLGALHPIAAGTTQDYQAIGKWISPQFKKERVAVTKRAKQKGKHHDCCRAIKKATGSISKPYKLRSSTNSKTGELLDGEGGNYRKEESVGSARKVDNSNCEEDAIFHELPKCHSFDFCQQGNLGFKTPELTLDSRTSERKGKAHHLFSGCTPKWNKSVTVLAKDTP